MAKPPQPVPRRTYVPPVLVRHGTYQQLTQGGGGTARESGGAGSPKTKATGTN